jgi:hypothetical protein
VKRGRYDDDNGDDDGWSGTKMRTQTSRSSGTMTSRGDDMVERTARRRGERTGRRRRGGEVDGEGAWWSGRDVVEQMRRSRSSS